MKRALLCLALATLPACGWFASNKGAVAQDVGQIGSCVVSQALNAGTVDPGAIVSACAGSTLTDVEQIVGSLIAYYAAQPTTQPAASITLARLQAIHDKAAGK